jgi:tetratricopeptide (TPR) repeat protein
MRTHRAFLLCLLCSLFTTPFAPGQSARTDSLGRALSRATTNTTRVNLLNEIAYEYWSSDPAKVLDYSRQALQLAQKAGYQSGEARAYQGYGIYYWKTDQHAQAIAYYEKARKLYETIKDPLGVAKSLNNMGMVYRDQGNDVLALEYYLDALKRVQGQGDAKLEANALNSIGLLYKDRQNFTDAAAYLNQALAKWQQLGMNRNVAGAYSNLATLSFGQKQYDKALEYNQKALALFEELKDLNGQIICHNNLGDFMLNTNRTEEARRHFEAATALNRTYGNKKWHTSSLMGLGEVYARQKQYPDALARYDSAYHLAQDAGMLRVVQTAAAGLARIHALRQDYQKAYRYQLRYSTLKDSLFSTESTGQLASLRAAFEDEKKQARIQLLEKEESLARATRNVLLVSLAALLVIGALLLYQQRVKVRKNQELLEKTRQLHETQQALVHVQLHNSQLQARQLQEELEFRNKSLTTHTLNLIQKNGIMEEIRETISEVLKAPRKDENAPVYGRLIKLIDYSFNLDKDWDDFKVYFEQVHKGFFVKLKEKHPELSNGELKMAALVRLNMNLKETATVMGISPDSVKTSRYRLRKKLQLEEEQNMTDYLMTI